MIDARGESGQAWADREQFHRVLALVESRRIGVLILALHSRSGRNDPDTSKLIEALQRTDGFLIAEGRLYDPRDHNELLQLRIHSGLSEHQAAAFRGWMMTTKLSLAQHCALRIPLPAGLVWAAPNDDYLAALESAAEQCGMPDWARLLREEPMRWEASSLARGGEDGSLLPLWFPDADVMRASLLRVEWLLETRSVADVARRIATHADWPAKYRGSVPTFRCGQWRPGMRAAWAPTDRRSLRTWLASPALYGIYSFTSGRSHRLRQEDYRAMPHDVFERNVFPAYAESAVYDRVRALLAAPRRPRRHNAEVVDEALLTPRCGFLRHDGTRCDRKLYAVAHPGRVVRYTSVDCTRPEGPRANNIQRHVADISGRALDELLLSVLAEVFSAARIRDDLKGVSVRADDLRAQIGAVKSQEAECAADLAAAEASEDQSRREGKLTLIERARQRQVLLVTQLSTLENQRSELESRAADVRKLTGAEAARVLALAEQVPTLFAAARAHPRARARLRALLQRCIAGVTVRQIARSTYDVEITFVNNTAVRRPLRTQNLHLPPQACAYAHAALARGVPPAEVLRDFRQHASVHALRGVLDDARVEAAAVEYACRISPQLARTAGGAEQHWVELNTLATDIGVPTTELLGPLFSNRLGRARSVDGRVEVLPNRRALHAQFPKYAARTVEREAGWPCGEAASLATLSTLLGLHSSQVKQRAEACTDALRADLTGRWWVRSSALGEAAGFGRALAARPDLATLDPSGWTPFSTARRRTQLPAETLSKVAPILEVPRLDRTGGPVVRRLVWLGPAVLERIAAESLRSAVDTVNSASSDRGAVLLDPAHFRPRRVVVPHLARCTRRSAQCIERGLRHTDTARVRALAIRRAGTAHSLRMEEHLLIPPSVWDATDEQTASAWLDLPPARQSYRLRPDGRTSSGGEGQ